MPKPLITAIKITLLSFSLPLLFTGSAWAKACTETDVNVYLKDNIDALLNCNSETIPVLIKALNHSDDNIRSHAVSALFSHIGIRDDLVVPALVEVLKDQS